MPRASHYTHVASKLAQLAAPARADLHAHTTASDGEYTASQVVAQARIAGLRAVAITDHDTLAAVEDARAAAGAHIEVVPGVEISTSLLDAAPAGTSMFRCAGRPARELHLLGYFLRTDHHELNAVLAAVCESRRERFRDFISLLREQGRAVPEDRVRLVEEASVSLGRRHVAGLVVACGHAKTRTEAFHRFVNPLARKVRSKALVPIADAIALVHAANGVASLAHPPADFAEEQFAALRACGLDAIEVVYPWGRKSPVKRLREVAQRFGFAISGGSDCHGPEPAHRRVGSHAITSDELAALRACTGCAVR